MAAHARDRLIASRTVPRRGVALLGITQVALLVTGCGEATTHTPSPSPPTSTAAPDATGSADLQDAYIRVVQAVRSSVVQIQTNSGLGSGIAFDNTGDVVTNNHVVAGATTIQVTTAEGKSQSASLVGAFPAGDLAVIRVAGPLQPAAFADSSTLKVGMIVLAVGNPLGLQSSVTEGIVSAVDRTVSESGGITLPDTIQTSAAINPGNSGGALVDLAGRVVGIPTLTAVDPGLGAANGIGFAIPANTVKDIAAQIIANGHVVNSHRADLGIRSTTVVDNAGSPLGVLVTGVTQAGPSDQAGITTGDIIIDLGATRVRTTSELTTLLADLKPGDKVAVRLVTRDGAQQTVTVTLAEIPGG